LLNEMNLAKQNRLMLNSKITKNFGDGFLAPVTHHIFYI